MRLDRLLAITLMLINRKRITAHELAEYFEVSARTIYRDIEAINLAGIPVVSFQGNSGGFGILEGYTVDRQMLTIEDMTAILSALKGINATFEDRKIDTTIEKITSLVPADKSDLFSMHEEQVILDILPWGYGTKQKEKLRMIHRCIKESRIIGFSYRNLKGQVTRRKVEPMSLILKGASWYLYGYCLYREDFRLFRLSRIRDPERQTEPFQRREKKYEHYHLDTLSQNQQQLTEILLRFPPEAYSRVEEAFDQEELSKDENGYFLARITWPEDQWVYSWILSFGDEVEVLEPPHIRKIIREKALKISSFYP